MTELQKELIKLVKSKDWLSFVEVEQFFRDNGINPVGDLTYELANKNVIFWAGLSWEALDVLEPLINRKLFLHPADLLVYLIDGRTMQLPIAKRLPAVGYKDPHWLPVCFRTVPLKIAG